MSIIIKLLFLLISQDKAKQSAKESFARVIYDTMKRRGIKTINHKVVPEVFTSANEILNLLNYQTNRMHRLISKIKSYFRYK